MSGGYFNYDQHRITDIADSIGDLVEDKGYSDDILEKFEFTAILLRRAATMVHRIDWLVSGDDSEEAFLERWDDEIQNNT